MALSISGSRRFLQMESHACGLLCTLLSPNLLLSRSLHVVAWVRASSCLYGQITSYRVAGPRLHQHQGTGLRAVCSFVAVDTAAVNIHVHVFGWICAFASLGYAPRSGVAGHRVTPLYQAFPKWLHHFPPPPAVCEGPLFTSCPALTIRCLILAILKGVMWHLIACLTIKPNFHKPA